MKSFAIFLISLGVGTASAETLTLATTGGWGALHQYHDVANSADLSITIYIGSSGLATVYLDGDGYTGTYNGSGIPSLFYSLGKLPITLTINETTRRVCARSGRGQHCSTIWTLVDGTLIRPDPPAALVAVPAVIGLDSVSAIASLEATGLIVTPQYVDDNVDPNDTVIGISPDVGALVSTGTEVIVLIALGPLPTV